MTDTAIPQFHTAAGTAFRQKNPFVSHAASEKAKTAARSVDSDGAAGIYDGAIHTFDDTANAYGTTHTYSRAANTYDGTTHTYYVNLTASPNENTARKGAAADGTSGHADGAVNRDGYTAPNHAVNFGGVPNRRDYRGVPVGEQGSNRQNMRSDSRAVEGQYRYQRYQGQNVPNVQTQSFANTRTQGFANAQTTGFTNTRTQGFANAQAQGFTNTRTQGFANAQAQGFTNTRTQGFANRQAQSQNIAANNRSYMKSQSAANRAADAQAIKETFTEPVKAASAIRKRTVIKLHTIISERRYSFPVSIVLIALLFTFLILAIVTTSVQISEVTREKSALEKDYSSLVADENELRMLLETRDDLRVVEEMATEELGMVKKDQVERYYLSSFKEDKIELVNEATVKQSNFWSGFADMFNGIVDRIKLFFSR